MATPFHLVAKATQASDRRRTHVLVRQAAQTAGHWRCASCRGSCRPIPRIFSLRDGLAEPGQLSLIHEFWSKGQTAALPQQMQRNTLWSERSEFIRNGLSVAARLVTSNAAGESCLVQFSSVFASWRLIPYWSRVPSSLKPMIVTIFGAPLAAASVDIGCRPSDHHHVARLQATPAHKERTARHFGLISG